MHTCSGGHTGLLSGDLGGTGKASLPAACFFIVAVLRSYEVWADKQKNNVRFVNAMTE